MAKLYKNTAKRFSSAWLRNLLDKATKSSELIGEGGRGGGQSRKSKVRSENSKLDFRASEIDI